LLAKPTPRNVNLGSDRFAMFNKNRDIPSDLAKLAFLVGGGLVERRDAKIENGALHR